MFHRKAPSPAYNSQQKLRETASAKLTAAKLSNSYEQSFIESGNGSNDRFWDEANLSVAVPENTALRSFQLNPHGKRQSDLINLIRKKRLYPIAPDGQRFYFFREDDKSSIFSSHS